MWWLWAVVASAGEQEAELYRLQQELSTLAQKNAWAGVSRTFVELQALGMPLTLDDMSLGAQAARTEGNMLAAMERLQLGVQRAPAEAGDTATYRDAKAAIDDLQARYGFVHVVVYEEGKKFPNVERPELPFSPEDQRAIVFAQERIAANRAFMGLLPVGSYRLGDQTFEVEPVAASPKMLELRVGLPGVLGE